MKPVDQKIIDPEKGDCMAACIASIFETSVDEVPGFDKPEWEGWPEICAWLRERNVYMRFIPKPDQSLPGYSIGIVESMFKNQTHAVVVKDGKIIHCPNPNRHGMGKEIMGLYVFIMIDPSKQL